MVQGVYCSFRRVKDEESDKIYCQDVAAEWLQDDIENDVNEELRLPDNTTVLEQMRR